MAGSFLTSYKSIKRGQMMAKIRVATNNFFQLGRNWMCYTAPNLQSLVKAKKKGPAIHFLLLQHSYLLASELAATVIKM